MKKCIKDFYTGIVKNKKLKTWIKHWILSIPAKIKGIWSEIITGTTFTLENSLERVFNKFDLKGNTSQNTTTQSANLFDANYYNNDTLYSTGVYKYTKLKIKGDRILVFKAKLKEGKTTISGLYLCISTVGPNPNQGTSAFSIRGGLISETDYYANFTGSDDIYLSFYPNTISVADIFATYDLMISTSDINYVPFVPDSPSPDYPQSVQTVSGNNTITISNSDGTEEQNLPINLKSKNLWDEQWELGRFDITTSSADFGEKVNTTNQIRTKNFIEIKPNTSYYGVFGGSAGAMFVIAYDETFKGIASYGFKNFTNASITTPNDAKYLKFYCTAEYGTTYGNNIAIVEGSTATAYEPYYNYELSKIGTAQDYFYKDEDKWYLHKATGKIILDGTENWNEYPSQTSDGYRVYETVKPAGPSGSFWLNNGRIL